MIYVWGIDPGNVSAGLACCEVNNQQNIYHQTLRVWKDDIELPQFEPDSKHLFFVEVPAHGTPVTREGIAWAGGMIIGRLISQVPMSRRAITKVKPNKWRRGLGLNVRQYNKDTALKFCTHHGLDVASDDEAEAVLIMRYGLTQVLKGTLKPLRAEE